MEKFFYLRHLCEIFDLNVFVVFGNCNGYDNVISSHPILSVIILVIVICKWTVEEANHTKSTQPNPPITELIKITITTTTYPKK